MATYCNTVMKRVGAEELVQRCRRAGERWGALKTSYKNLLSLSPMIPDQLFEAFDFISRHLHSQ